MVLRAGGRLIWGASVQGYKVLVEMKKKVLVARRKSSRDVPYNTGHGVSRTERAHQSSRGKAGVSFLHLHLEAPPFSDSSRTAYGVWCVGTTRGSLQKEGGPQYQVSQVRGKDSF